MRALAVKSRVAGNAIGVMEAHMARGLKVAMIFLAVISAFNLGRASIEFSGSGAAWTSLVLGLMVLAISLITVISDTVRSK